jgi:hypothetical protein
MNSPPAADSTVNPSIVPSPRSLRFHIVHVVPPISHGPLGYREVIETLHWGLLQLGQQATIGCNQYLSDRINIFVGGQMLSAAELERIPANSIFYHLEQIAGVEPENLAASLPIIAARFRVWDYCAANIQTWLKLKPAFEPRLLPIGWAPLLRRIPPAEEDIDVLFYGIPSPQRLGVFDQLCRAAVKVVFACGLYGTARDSLIAQAKIVLNLNYYDMSKVFEIVRVSYLLANEKAVVSDIHPDSIIEDDLRDAVALAPPQAIVGECIGLLRDDVARKELARRGRTIFEKRDIVPLLRAVISDLSA